MEGGFLLCLAARKDVACDSGSRLALYKGVKRVETIVPKSSDECVSENIE